MGLILSVDPGKMTGYASLDIDHPLETFTAGQAEFMDFNIRAAQFCARNVKAQLVCERFVISGGTLTKARGDVNWSIETIGVLRFLVAVDPAKGHTFELQSASDAMKFAPNDRLRKFRWHTPGRDHANDAARHLLLFIARRHQPVFERLLARTSPGGG